MVPHVAPAKLDLFTQRVVSVVMYSLSQLRQGRRRAVAQSLGRHQTCDKHYLPRGNLAAPLQALSWLAKNR